MVWGAFSAAGKSKLAFLDGNQNSDDYQKTLESYLLPSVEAKHAEHWIFQQDGASIHTSKASRKWLRDHEIAVLDWVAKSPDLNPIENVWGVLARKVYANSRHFNSVSELQKCVQEEWDDISPSFLKVLVEGMLRRFVSVLQRRGQKTKY